MVWRPLRQSVQLGARGRALYHDPSTVTFCDGKFYTFGTGGGGLISDDGWTWRSGGVRPGAASPPTSFHREPLLRHLRQGRRRHVGRARRARLRHVDEDARPELPDFGFHDETVVATSDGVEDCDAIDSAFLLDPRPDACGSATGPSSATSASSSSIQDGQARGRQPKPSTSPSTWRRRR